VLVEDATRMATVREVFRLAANGHTDREVAASTGLVKSHVAEILTNPIYVGSLRSGGHRPPAIDRELWERAQASRARHARRHPGPTSYRQYLLSGLIRCRACGRRLIGHSGRYRHTDACPAYRQARQDARWDRRGAGDSYSAHVYDDVLPRALSRVTATATLVADVSSAIESLPDTVNELAVQRIRRARRDATAQLEQDRDTAAWKAAMDRLDAEEAHVRASGTGARLTRRAVAESLMDLERLYRSSEIGTQRRIVRALFDQVEVLGPTRVWLYPSDEAVACGWATMMSGEFTMELRQTGRGERGSASLTHLRFRPRFVLENRTRTAEVWPLAGRKAG
jgi:hypothetical protein